MHKDQSLKAIDRMPASDRWRLAKAKLSAENNEGAVPALINHLRVHENNRWLNYEKHLPNQIPKSHGANAFNSLQMSSLHYEFIRLCTFWDPVDLDSRSIPTIVALADCEGVARCVYDDHFTHYERYDTLKAQAWGRKARRKLRDGIRGAAELESSEILRHSRNYRDKLAHQLEQTREEKKGFVPPPRYGDEKKLLGRTITNVNRLYLSLNGVGFLLGVCSKDAPQKC